MMKNRNTLTICLLGSFLAVLGYKLVVHEEPWAIGMSQVLILDLFLVLFFSMAWHFDKTKSIIALYFNGSESPVNLAVFRIIFFGYLLLTFDANELIWFSRFPKDLQFAPLGMGWLLPHMPINDHISLVVLSLFKTSCFLAIIGLFGRFFTVVAAVTGFYVLGVPQFYGSVSHNHHIFWFLVIFAVSRCTDTLSVDAVLSGFKKADSNENSGTPEQSKTYALPLRFIWILMGLCYFFPGFWKLWNSGSAWIFGDNMCRHMFLDWVGFDYWLPVFRIDQWPWLCRLSGLMVIFFELNFLFLIFFPRLRYFALFEGLFFHNMTNLLMNINFYELQICYTSLVNWNTLFKWCGKKIFVNELIVLYDGSCSLCRRVIAFLQVFDILGRIDFLDLHGSSSEALRERLKLTNEVLMQDMHAVMDTKVLKGFTAYRNIAARIPLLWLIYPFLFLQPVQTIGNNIYRNVADHRACRIPPKKIAGNKEEASHIVLTVTASILIIGNLILGGMGHGSGWPFACYPTFSELAWDRLRTIECELNYEDQTKKIIKLESLKHYTGSFKIVGIVGKIFDVKNEEERNKKFYALWEVLQFSDPDLKKVHTVRFYFLENYADPEKWHLNPIERKLAYEFDVSN